MRMNLFKCSRLTPPLPADDFVFLQFYLAPRRKVRMLTGSCFTYFTSASISISAATEWCSRAPRAEMDGKTMRHCQERQWADIASAFARRALIWTLINMGGCVHRLCQSSTEMTTDSRADMNNRTTTKQLVNRGHGKMWLMCKREHTWTIQILSWSSITETAHDKPEAMWKDKARQCWRDFENLFCSFTYICSLLAMSVQSGISMLTPVDVSASQYVDVLDGTSTLCLSSLDHFWNIFNYNGSFNSVMQLLNMGGNMKPMSIIGYDCACIKYCRRRCNLVYSAVFLAQRWSKEMSPLCFGEMLIALSIFEGRRE